MNQAEHRAKNFRVRKLAGGRETIKNRGGQEISCLIFENSRAASIQNGLGTFPDTGVDETFDASLTFFADDRPHLHAGVETVPDLNFRSGSADGTAKRLLRFADRDGYGTGETALARAAESAVADDLRRQLHVGIGQDDDVILCAALALHALAAGRGAPVHMPGHRRRADETDGAPRPDRKSTRLNSSHVATSYALLLAHKKMVHDQIENHSAREPARLLLRILDH